MKKFGFLLALSFAVAALYSQTTPHSLILFLEIDGDYTTDEREMLTETLLIRLAEASGEKFSVIPSSSTRPADSDMKTFVIASGGSGFLEVSIQGSRLNTTLGLRAFDVIENKELVSGEQKARFDRRMRVLLDFFWDDVIATLTDSVEPRDTGVTLVLRAPGGTTVSGPDEYLHVMDESGITEIRLQAPANYRFLAELPDHEPLTRRVFLEREGTELDLTPDPMKRFRVAAGLEWLGFPKLELSYSPIAGKLFVGAGASTLLFGVTPTLDLEDEDPSLVDSFPVTFPFIFADWYFQGPRSPVKFFTGGDVYLKLNHEPRFSIDPLLPWGIRGRLGMEVPVFSNLAASMAWVPQWFYVADPTAFGSTLPNSSDGGYLVTPIGSFAVPVVDITVRWYP